MKVIIIEDEPGVAENLQHIIESLTEDIEVLGILESVEEAVDWFQNNPKPDLGFFDIRLSDGESFDIFEQVNIEFPVIFTTAYNQYALKAFQVNSVDYLLKPLNEADIEKAIQKYKKIYPQKNLDNEALMNMISELRLDGQKKFKKSFLVHVKDRILPIHTKDIAYFYLENELVFCRTFSSERYLIDQALDKLGEQLNPEEFFRANRQFIIARSCVRSAAKYFGRKLKLEVLPESSTDIIISKTRVTEFKTWLES